MRIEFFCAYDVHLNCNTLIFHSSELLIIYIQTNRYIILHITYCHRPKDSETHFKVIVISSAFQNTKTPISRHRLINSTLKEEVASDGPIHALSIVAYTPEKWQEKINNGEGIVGKSPSCRGGDGSLPPK